MKSFVAFSALAAIAAAAPHAKRDIAWVVHTDVVTEVVDVTKTVWLGADQTETPAAPAQQQNKNANPHNHQQHHKSAQTTVATVIVQSPAPSAISTSSPSSAPLVEYTPVSIPETTPATTQQTTAPSPTPYVAPTTPSQAAPSSAPPASASSAAPVQSSSAPASYGGSSGSGSCADQSGTCTDAKFTYYSTGMGSCGIESTDSDYIFAYGSAEMAARGGANPNANPLCGKKVSIKAYDGTAITATLVDTCAACSGKDAMLDLSPGLWNRIAQGMPGADGVLSNMEFTWL